MMIKDIVVNNFKAAEVMEKYGIDFCCKGKRELKIALDEKKIDESKFLKDLEQAILKPSASEERYENWELYFLTQYIVNKHHSYVKEAIPRITAHVDKVADRHGEKYPFLIEVRDLFHSVANEMTSHMMKEERILFPLIKYITDCRRFNEKPKNEGYNSVKGPINQMEYEHDSAGSAMQSIRELTNNYKLPDDACTTFTVTYQELDEFEKDLHKHVHLENNILFPGIIRIEEELMKGKY
jgi:regulator of cell morphogenesis and NO signaling